MLLVKKKIDGLSKKKDNRVLVISLHVFRVGNLRGEWLEVDSMFFGIGLIQHKDLLSIYRRCYG